MGPVGIAILFVFILIAYLIVLMVIRRTRKTLINQLENLDTELRNNLREELEKEGIFGKKT